MGVTSEEKVVLSAVVAPVGTGDRRVANSNSLHLELIHCDKDVAVTITSDDCHPTR